MARWLFKEEPTHYSFADLERDRTTLWDGVTNNLARQHLRQVARGDRILYYHTGDEKAVVGEMRAVSGPRSDPNAPDDPKAVAIEVEAVRRLQHPVPLNVLRNEEGLAGWDLLRLPRLSVVPVSDEQWRLVIALSRRRP